MNQPSENSLERSNQIREQVEREFACRCVSKLIVVKVQKNGRRYHMQCETCGNLEPLKSADLSESEQSQAIPYDKSIKDKWWQARSARASELYERDKKEQQAEFDRWYQDYLSSPEWQAKRVKVFQRSSGLCEGCLVNPATQVHHLTYVRVGREMLFDLVAICETCHRQIHEPAPAPSEEWDEDVPF
jgi:transcription elongation factor Elf1